MQSADEVSKGNYFAIVEGSEVYELESKIENNHIKNIDCNCPYDDGICKHAVAVLFAVQAEELQLHDEQNSANSKSKKNSKSKNP